MSYSSGSPARPLPAAEPSGLPGRMALNSTASGSTGTLRRCCSDWALLIKESHGIGSASGVEPPPLDGRSSVWVCRKVCRWPVCIAASSSKPLLGGLWSGAEDAHILTWGCLGLMLGSSFLPRQTSHTVAVKAQILGSWHPLWET